MFGTAKTLIVVYKDEMILNQLKKLVESKDDTEEQVVGVRDNSINIVAWTEKVWLANKKPGNIQGKILFLGDIKGTDKLLPVIDVEFDKYGIKYGWAGNQGILNVDTKALTERDTYLSFINELSQLPIPESYKVAKNVNISEKNEETTATETNGESENQNSTFNLLKEAKLKFSRGAASIEKNGKMLAMKAEDFLRDKSYVSTQMMFYGVIHLYNNGLEKFMGIHGKSTWS